MIQSADGRVLILERSSEGDAAGVWAFPGGKMEEGETAEQAAIRECQEEIGHDPTAITGAGPLMLHCRRQFGDVDYTTFRMRVPETFTPQLNNEHVGFMWIYPEKLNET